MNEKEYKIETLFFTAQQRTDGNIHYDDTQEEVIIPYSRGSLAFIPIVASEINLWNTYENVFVKRKRKLLR